jgi:catechol 2,3-dioxygenase-like lactoylglutathione lyase family enzyme
MQLTHVRLLIERFDECFRFYRDVLGLPIGWGEEGGSYASFETGEPGGATLSLFSRREMAEAVGYAGRPGNSVAQDRVAVILKVDDLDGTVARIAAQGGAFVNRPIDRPDWGIRAAHLRDPDGNLLELYTNLTREQWTDELRTSAERYRGE